MIGGHGLKQQMLKAYIEKIFDKYDTDNSGGLDQKQLTYFFNDLFKALGIQGTVTEQNSKEAIRQMDQNGDGTIDKKQLYDAFQIILSQQQHNNMNSGYSNGYSYHQHPNQYPNQYPPPPYQHPQPYYPYSPYAPQYPPYSPYGQGYPPYPPSMQNIPPSMGYIQNSNTNPFNSNNNQQNQRNYDGNIQVSGFGGSWSKKRG